MNKKLFKENIFIISVFVIFLFIIIYFKSQSKTYNYSFTNVVNYLSEKFTCDVTAFSKNSISIWKPNFLPAQAVHSLKTEEYDAGKKLKFRVGFFQIGGERFTFTIVKINENETKILVDHVIIFFIPFTYLPGSERGILNTIEKELRDFSIYGVNYQSDVLFKDIIKLANFSENETYKKLELKKLLFSSPIVILGTIESPNTITSIDESKSWPAVKICANRILKGQRQKGLGFYTNTINTSNINIDYSDKKKDCIFFLELDKDISSLCGDEIFRLIEVFPAQSESVDDFFRTH